MSSGTPTPTSTSSLERPRADQAREDDPDAVTARRIHGVRIRRVPGFHDHRGSLYPFLDLGDPFWSEPLVHGFMFTVRPGRIKGWGMHQRQADRYVVASGELRTVLYDDREGSPDRGNFCQFFFTAASPGLLFIPPGVWHATQNFGKVLGRVFNLPTVPFDAERPDKYRIDPSSGEIPFDWRLPDS